MKIVFYLLIFIHAASFAQNNKKFIDYIHFSTTTYFEPNAYVRLGISKDLNTNHNVQLDFGYGNHFSKNQLNRFYTRAVYKYYTSKAAQVNKFYLLYNLFLNANKNERFNSNYLIGNVVSHADTTTYITYSKADMHINKIGGDIGFGYLIIIYKGIYINSYLGIGLANRSVRYKNIENKKTEQLQYQGLREWVDYTRFFQEKSLPAFSCKGGVELVIKL